MAKMLKDIDSGAMTTSPVAAALPMRAAWEQSPTPALRWSSRAGVVIALGEGYGMDKHGLGLRAPFRAARRSTSCINWVCRSARMPHLRRRFLWANQAWCGTAFGISVAFRMSTNSVPSLVRVLCAVIENETGYRRLSHFPAQSPALQRLAKKNGTWDLAQTRSDHGAAPEGQSGRGSIPGASTVLRNYSRQEPGPPPQKRARLIYANKL